MDGDTQVLGMAGAGGALRYYGFVDAATPLGRAHDDCKSLASSFPDARVDPNNM